MSLFGYKARWGKSPAHLAFPGRVRAAKPRVKRKTVRKTSKAKSKLDAVYRLLKTTFLRDHPWCAVKFCACPAIDIHHSHGRTRTLQNDVRFWVGLCRDHHGQVHREPELARRTTGYAGTAMERPLLCGKGDWQRQNEPFSGGNGGVV